MKNLMKNLIKKGKNALVYSALGLATVMPFAKDASAITREQMMNPFVRPNVRSMNYYGSGDANNDNQVDEQDLQLIKTNSYTNADWADVNGDGIVNNEDVYLLESYLNKEIPHLPSDWDKLETREEKENWFNKMNNVEKLETHTQEYIEKLDWGCIEFSRQYFTNFFGIKKLMQGWENSLFEKENCRFNLPVYISARGPPLPAHEFNAILVGNDALNFDDWTFIEPQTGKIVNIGDWSMPKNSVVVIYGVYDQAKNGKDGILEDYLISFNSGDNGEIIPSFRYYNPKLITTKPTLSIEKEKQSPLEIKLNPNYPNPFNSATTISYNLENDSNVELDIYNLLGQKIETLISGYQSKGTHNIKWNPENLPSGTYISKLRAGNNQNSRQIQTQKMMLVK